MSDKTGKHYEKLAQVVFQWILNQSDIRNIVVQHNVALEGKHAKSHQIDVYWKFEVGGVQYETIVQAKDWKNPVNLGELLKFKSVLDDLPGQPKGIVVSRNGYQSGAKEWALAHGILLYELKEFKPLPPLAMTVGGWAKIKLVPMPLGATVMCEGEEIDPKKFIVWGFDWDICTPSISDLRLDVSSSWLKQEYPTKDLSDVQRLEFPPTPLTEFALYNQEGAVIGNLQVVLSQCATAMRDESVDQKRLTHTFTEPTFIRVTSPVIPYLKINAVSMNVETGRRHGQPCLGSRAA